MTFDSNSSNKKRQRNDKLSRYVVTGFGGLVLLTLVILITHLISQALPLTYIPNLKILIFSYIYISIEKLENMGQSKVLNWEFYGLEI